MSIDHRDSGALPPPPPGSASEGANGSPWRTVHAVQIDAEDLDSRPPGPARQEVGRARSPDSISATPEASASESTGAKPFQLTSGGRGESK